MPSTRARRTVVLAVVALAVVAAVPVNAVDATAVRAGATSEQASESVRSPVDAFTEADGNATANVTIRSGTGVEWADLRDRTALRAAIADGTLSRADAVAVGDPLVVSLRHVGLADYLARGNATRRFFSTVESRAANLSFAQTNPSPERRPARIHYPRNATRVVADADRGVTHVVLATTRAPVVRDGGDDGPERVERYDGYAFVARLTLSGEANLTAAGDVEVTSDEFLVERRQARLAVDDEVARVAYANPAPNQTVRGETNVRPGLNVAVVARGRDDPGTAADESFVRTATVPVRDGPDDAAAFAATFDFADVPDNATARLDVRYDGRSILGENASVVVVEPTASLRVSEVEPNATGPYARVRADADLSRGGFVVLHRGSADGPIVGASRFLARGSRSNVTVYVGDRVEESGRLVAVAHRDANHNRWFDGPERDPAYAGGGSAGSGVAAVRTDHVLRPGTTRRATRTATPTLATTRTRASETTRTEGTTGTPETAGTPTKGTAPETTTGTATVSDSNPATTRTPDSPASVPIPGFGVASAVVALLAVGVRAARQ